jgi:hypothetical protein
MCATWRHVYTWEEGRKSVIKTAKVFNIHDGKSDLIKVLWENCYYLLQAIHLIFFIDICFASELLHLLFLVSHSLSKQRTFSLIIFLHIKLLKFLCHRWRISSLFECLSRLFSIATSQKTDFSSSRMFLKTFLFFRRFRFLTLLEWPTKASSTTMT